MINPGELVEDPFDGLGSRANHDWAERKHHYLRRYMDIFSKGMSKKWPNRAYVDLFAGPGRHYNIEARHFDDASPMLSFDYPFTHRVFVEQDERVADILEARCRARAPKGGWTVIQGSCNTVIDRVVAALPTSGLRLAFIDPTSWQVQFPTVRKLVSTAKTDLIFTFMDGMMKRVPNSKDLDRFFGTDAYRVQARYLGTDGKFTSEGLLACYRDQLATVGYVGLLAERELPVMNHKNNIMYRMAFFSKDPKGYEFWDKISGEDEVGQLTLF
jgi:three-Cys-motif partner protein